MEDASSVQRSKLDCAEEPMRCELFGEYHWICWVMALLKWSMTCVFALRIGMAKTKTGLGFSASLWRVFPGCSEWSLNFLLIFQEAEQVDAAVYCGRFFMMWPMLHVAFLACRGIWAHRLSANGSIPCLHRPHLRLQKAFFRRAQDRSAESDVPNEL